MLIFRGDPYKMESEALHSPVAVIHMAWVRRRAGYINSDLAQRLMEGTDSFYGNSLHYFLCCTTLAFKEDHLRGSEFRRCRTGRLQMSGRLTWRGGIRDLRCTGTTGLRPELLGTIVDASYS